jgi:hypothetical protein
LKQSRKHPPGITAERKAEKQEAGSANVGAHCGLPGLEPSAWRPAFGIAGTVGLDTAWLPDENHDFSLNFVSLLLRQSPPPGVFSHVLMGGLLGRLKRRPQDKPKFFAETA